MAIFPTLPGLEVTIRVADSGLSEYDYSNTTDLPNTATKYIAALDSAAFSIYTLYRAPYDPPFPVHTEIIPDETYVQALFVEPGGEEGCEGYVYGSAMQNDERVTPEQKRRVNEMGTITVYMYFIAALEDVGPHTVPEAQVEQSGALS